jgi:hypothetical protein
VARRVLVSSRSRSRRHTANRVPSVDTIDSFLVDRYVKYLDLTGRRGLG